MQLNLFLAFGALVAAAPHPSTGRDKYAQLRPLRIQLGPRPYFLVNDMDDGPLKEKLLSCADMDFRSTSFSIGHRGGGTLMIPEHTKESILAGTRMGAGIQECDVTFTKDRQLVCRHAQCDLHTTTNILVTDLAAKCTEPFTPAANGTAASAKCCASDITLEEFKTLCGKMDASNPEATTPEEFLGGTPNWRTDLYAQCGTVQSLREHIALVDAIGGDFTPELKTPEVTMPFEGNYTQEMFAQQMLDEFTEAGITPRRVWPQSFLYEDVLYWLGTEFAAQAVYLDENGDTLETYPLAVANLTRYAADGVKVVAPPLPYLVTLDENHQMVPSEYAVKANKLGLKIVTWSLERSGRLGDESKGGYYYTGLSDAIDNDGDVFSYLHVLAQDVGVIGVFSDWSATVTYYANCFGIF